MCQCPGSTLNITGENESRDWGDALISQEMPKDCRQTTSRQEKGMEEILPQSLQKELNRRTCDLVVLASRTKRQ